jgi:hypothetical protein
MAPWLMIAGSGLDDCIYWHLLIQSRLITINDCLTLAPFPFFHNCQLRKSTLLYLLCTDPKGKVCLLRRCLVIDLLEFLAFASAGMCLATSCLAWSGPHRKQFLQYLFYCCVRVSRPLPRNWSICHNMFLIMHHVRAAQALGPQGCVLLLLWCYYLWVGHAVAQLVEALCYKPEDRGLDSRWCHLIFQLT